MTEKINQKEKKVYDHFRAVYEAHEKRVWELEYIIDVMSINKYNKNIVDIEKEKQREQAAILVQKELDNIQQVLKNSKEILGSINQFMGDPVINGGIEPIIRRHIEKDVLNGNVVESPDTLKTAILNVFLEREKQSRASIYKRRFRGGFKSTAENLINEEKKKNEEYRKNIFLKYGKSISKEGINLIESAFKRRMARHGEEAI